MAMSNTELLSSAQETADLLSALPEEEPGLSLQWVLTQMSQEGAMSTFRNFFKNCEEADQFYTGEFDFSVPEGGNQVKLGTFHSIIETLVSHASPKFIDISVPPPGPRGQARAELIEKFLQGAHHMIQQTTPVQREIVKHQGLYGVSWAKYEFAGHLWSDFPDQEEDESEAVYKEKIQEIINKRKFTFPIVAEVINPQECVWDIASTTPRWIIKFCDMDASWVSAHFPEWEGKPNGTVEFLEVWTSTHVAYIADERWAMKPRKHTYGRIPFVKYYPQTGVKTIGRKPEHLYRGIGHGNFGMLRAESRLASQYLDIVGRNAWSNISFRGPRGLTEEVMSEYSQEPGARNYIPTNVEVVPDPIAEAPQSILIAMQTIKGAIEANTVPAVTRGERPVGAASGYHTAVLAGIASLNFSSVVDATERGMQESNEILLKIVENVINDEVTVFGKTETGDLDAKLKPNDIRGHYVSLVRLSSVSPEEQERKLSLWRDTWRAGFVDWGTALRSAGVSNPLEVIGNRIAEDFFNIPEVRMLFAQIAAEKLPQLSQAIQSATGATEDSAQQIANNILNTQGGMQLPNTGNFGPGNQAGAGAPTGNQTRPVMPGGIDEQNLVGRQMAGPRTGPRRTTTGADLAPGGGAYG